MTGAVVSLIALYCTVIFTGKFSRKHGVSAVLYICLITAVQVGAVMFFVFTMNTPETK